MKRHSLVVSYEVSMTLSRLFLKTKVAYCRSSSTPCDYRCN